MKIQELRDKLKQCNKDEVEKIASELYKMLPKSKKETDADQLIEAITSGNSVPKAKKQQPVMDFESLKSSINYFLECVDNNYYFAPNRIIPKAQRSKWRFEVKNYVKMLNGIPADGEHGEESAKLMRGLFQRLKEGCIYYKFPSTDPFNAIGISKGEFYSMLLNRTFATGYTDEKIKNMLTDIICLYNDEFDLPIGLVSIYVEALHTSDVKYKAIAIAKELVEKYEILIKQNKKHHDTVNRYNDIIMNLCGTILVISIPLCETDNAIKYYWSHVLLRDRERTLFELLYVVGLLEDDKLWIKIYEDALKKKIKPRDYLKEKYNKLTSTEKQ